MEVPDSPVQAKRPFPWKPVRRRRTVSDDFFLEGNAVCTSRHKQLALDNDDGDEDLDESDSKERIPFPCPVNTCSLTFTSVAEYEMHYHSRHKHICSVCQRFFPTAHLLDLHITEWHDTLFDLRAKSSDMYQCWVETCPQKFHTAKERKNHAIKIHKYPANFRFDKVRKTKKDPDKAHPPKGEVMETQDVPESDVLMEKDSQCTCTKASPSCDGSHSPSQNGTSASVPMDHVPSEQKTSRFVYKKSVPKAICFGHGSQRSFQQNNRGRGAKHKHWHQGAARNSQTKVNIEEVHMDDLSDALMAS